MAGKRVLLTLNPHIYEELKQKSKDNLMTLQEYISDILRKDILVSKPKKSSKAFLLFIFLILVISTANAAIIDQEIEEKLNQENEVSVIVILKDQSIEKKFGVASKKEILEEKKQMIKSQQNKVLSKLNQKKFGIFSTKSDLKLKHKYSTVNGFSGKLTKQGLEKLKNDPNVASIHINKKYSMTLDGSIPQINADDVWGLQLNSTNITGVGETICILDTGADYNHSSLGRGWGNKVIGGYDFVNSDSNPMDDHGHGTHVAGIVASDNDTYRGVAPDAKLIAIKVLDSNGNGDAADIIAGIDWCTDNASIFNISVISMSLGDCTNHSTYCNSDPIAPSINTAVGQNITVMVAAGNGPGGSCTGITNIAGPAGPACVENATAVGAVNSGDSISYQRGALFEILAPGISIHSTQLNGGFVDKSGTSMSTPHAAGTAALLQQFNKLQNGTSLTVSQVKDVLNDTGVVIDDFGGSGYNFSRIDVYAAIISLDSVAPNITFVSPTLDNGSATHLDWVYINITSSETLSFLTLEWNGTNESMNGSGLNFYLNKTNLTKSNYTYRIHANDSANNWVTTNLRYVETNNSEPTIDSYYPNSSSVSIVEPNNQTFNITASDAENDTLVIIWYLNGSNVSNSDNYTFIGNYSAAGSYNITATVSNNYSTVSQYWNLTVNNTNRLPLVVNVTLVSSDSSNRTNGTLTGSWNYSDLDGDNQTDNETKWYNNSVEVSSLANLTSVASGNTTRGENWVFSVRVSDGTDWSNWTNSSSLVIQNTPPSMNTISNETVNATAIVNISVNATDLDEDTLNYSINDSNFNQTNNVFTWNTTVNDSGTKVVNITVTDNSSNISQLVYITVCLDSDGDGYNVTSSGCGTVDFDDTDTNKYPGASCSRICYSGSTYSTSGSCTGGSYTCDDDGGGGSSGGGGGTVSTGGKTFIVDFARGAYTKPLSQRDRIRFEFKSEQHHATVDNITDGCVRVKIESDPITVIIYESETVKVDIDNDDVYDLLITLNDILASQADFTFDSIAEPVVEEEIITPEEVPTTLVEEEVLEAEVVEEPVIEEPAPAEYRIMDNETLDDEEGYSILKESIFYILAAIISFLVIIFIIFRRKKKRGIEIHETKIHQIRKDLGH
jgi:subtilisin family serine protease/uncharacterized membrane protein YgcG